MKKVTFERNDIVSRDDSSAIVSDGLLGDLRQLIDSAKSQVVQTANYVLVALYWNVGKRIKTEILGNKRAGYGKEIVSALSRELTLEYGTGFSEANLWHMIRFAEVYPNEKILYALSRELSWTHFRHIIYIKDSLQRDFYAEMCRAERWSTRTLHGKIQGMLYERTAISKKPDELIRQELGTDFTFVARQKRITIDSEDYYLDLLFYHRGMRRLVVIELKLGKFQAADKGQMELYLRWLDKYEKREGEENPLGLILCAEKSAEHVELLQLENSGIRVAEYLTDLPPRTLLEARLHEAVRVARERIAAREGEEVEEVE